MIRPGQVIRLVFGVAANSFVAWSLRAEIADSLKELMENLVQP